MLEMQQALKGMEAPPALILEIQDIRTELEKLYRQVKEADVRTDALIRQVTEN